MSSIEQKKNLFSAFNWHFSLGIRFGPILLFFSCACGHMGCAAEVRLSKNGCAQKCCNNNNNESIHSLRNSMAATQCQHTPPLHICITKWPNAFGRPHLASGANRLQWRSTPFEMSSPASVMVIYFILFMEATGIINLFFAPLFSLPLHLSRFFLPCRVEQCPIPNTSKILTSHFQMRFTFRSPLQRCAHFYFFHYFYCISSSLMCPVVSYFVGFYFPFFLCVFFGLSGVRRQRLLSFGNVRRSFVFRDQIQRNEKQKKKMHRNHQATEWARGRRTTENMPNKFITWSFLRNVTNIRHKLYKPKIQKKLQNVLVFEFTSFFLERFHQFELNGVGPRCVLCVCVLCLCFGDERTSASM